MVKAEVWYWLLSSYFALQIDILIQMSIVKNLYYLLLVDA